jgi:hypothetical protein
MQGAREEMKYFIVASSFDGTEVQGFKLATNVVEVVKAIKLERISS